MHQFHRQLAAGMRKAAVSADWWLPAGITQSDLVQVFQPKGAASYATSLSDLSGNGNNASTISAPAWNATDGWIFSGTEYLDSNVVPVNDGTWSVFVRYSDASTTEDSFLVGLLGNAGGVLQARFRIELDFDTSNRILILNSGDFYYQAVSQEPTSGVIGFAGGTPHHSNPSISFTAQSPLTYDLANDSYYIGAASNFGSATKFAYAKMQAIAVYNKTLSAAQVSALSASMEAL